MKHGVKRARQVIMEILDTLPERFTCDDVFKCWPDDQPLPRLQQMNYGLNWLRLNKMLFSDGIRTYWRPKQREFVHTQREKDWEAFKRNPTQYLASL